MISVDVWHDRFLSTAARSSVPTPFELEFPMSSSITEYLPTAIGIGNIRRAFRTLVVPYDFIAKNRQSSEVIPHVRFRMISEIRGFTCDRVSLLSEMRTLIDGSTELSSPPWSSCAIKSVGVGSMIVTSAQLDYMDTDPSVYMAIIIGCLAADKAHEDLPNFILSLIFNDEFLRWLDAAARKHLKSHVQLDKIMRMLLQLFVNSNSNFAYEHTSLSSAQYETKLWSFHALTEKLNSKRNARYAEAMKSSDYGSAGDDQSEFVRQRLRE